jgi:WD40 repeat protein
MTKVRAALALAAALIFAVPAHAQQYFGQNQVQFDHFKWKIMETDHFLVHYYPEEQAAVTDAARMAERSYARLSRLLNHQFREKKPLVLYRSRGDFGQNNVTGDLGEGVGGVTEALRHRILLPFTGDYKSFEHVLAHELVHAFQYDIFARGKAGGGLQTLQQVQPPGWFMEGMAEYLSLGPNHIQTQAVMRDAALNGNLPTILQMTNDPQRYFPYRFGEALWEYIGGRWGDEVISEILNSTPNVGIERSFKRELGLSLEELGDEWRESMQVKHLPQVASLDRARKFSEPLLNQRKSGGYAQLFIAPALSPDGKQIVFISVGSFLRGEVFPDLWLANGETGKRIRRLVRSTTTADFEELRQVYSQSSFSPDGKQIAFTAQRDGKDVLYIMNSRGGTPRRIDIGLEWLISPSWSPDGKQILVSGSASGLSDLYIIDVATGQGRRLTNDKFAELQPQWSPDGKSIAFVTDRGADTDFELLRFNLWRIAVMDLGTSRIDVLPNQDGLNLNPQWAPDSKSIAFLSDRTGTANIFLYDLEARQHFQLTNVIGAIGSFTEYSPAISWAHQADRMAFTYYENGDYTIWSFANPRKLKKEPYVPTPRVPTPVIATLSSADSSTRLAQADRTANMLAAIEKASRSADSTRDESGRTVSLYRSTTGIRLSSDAPSNAERSGNAPVSVAQMLDSAALALPDTTKFKKYDYGVSFQPEAIYRPSVGYAQDNFGRGLYGGAGIVLADMLGNNRVIVAGQVNGRFSEAYALASYTNLASRFQYTTGFQQTPIFFVQNYSELPLADGSPRSIQTIELARYIIREAFAIGMRPSNRFTRFETGINATSIAVSTQFIKRGVDYGNGYATDFYTDSVAKLPGFNYVAPYAAWISDNSLFGYTGPISGRRYRLQVQPAIGGLRWTEYTADYRKYLPVLFNFLTLATRTQASIGIGRDEQRFPKYIGRADFVRGYDRNQFSSTFCGGVTSQQSSCSVTELLGSRVVVANAEVRFPLIRHFDLGLLPISLPPLDGLVFYDAGIAWSHGQSPSLKKPDNYNDSIQRYVLKSYGAGIRLNLFGFALLRWDYAIPLDRPIRKGYWQFSLGPSF